MKFLKRGVVILPIFLVLVGFGPFDWGQEEQDFRGMTDISLEDIEHVSKEDIEKKIDEYEAKNYRPVTIRRSWPKATPGTYIVSATAYSSTVDQCDASPFITASGSHVRDGIIAANFLPFGAKVKIPEIYGDKVFVVEDRMNQRYQSRIDVWMTSRGEALKFGVRTVKIEVL